MFFDFTGGKVRNEKGEAIDPEKFFDGFDASRLTEAGYAVETRVNLLEQSRIKRPPEA